MRKFSDDVRNCAAVFTLNAAHNDGTDYLHGTYDGSPDCTCGHYRHVVTSDGYIVPTIYDYGRRITFASDAAALGSTRSEKKAAASRANGKKGGRPIRKIF